MNKKLITLVLLLFVFALPVSAFVVDGSIYTAGVSKYLWRGGLLNDGPAIQSGVSFGAEGVTLQLWTSAHQEISPDLFDEIDLYANYEHSIPYLDVVTLGIGYASYMIAPYNYPNIEPSQEISFTIKSDVISTPYITWYHSLDAATTYNYLEAGVSYEHEIGELIGGTATASIAGTLGLDLNEAYLDVDTAELKEAADLTVAAFNLSFNYAIAGFTITPSALFQLSLNRESYYENDIALSLMVNYDFVIGTEEKTEEAVEEKAAE